MRDSDKTAVLKVLDDQRAALSDPFATVSTQRPPRQSAPRVRRNPFLWVSGLGISSLAAAALVVVLANPFAAELPGEGADLAWSGVIDDIWVAEVLPADDLLLSENDWNLLDLGDDQGI
jgi:hypothetical protein